MGYHLFLIETSSLFPVSLKKTLPSPHLVLRQPVCALEAVPASSCLVWPLLARVTVLSANR